MKDENELNPENINPFASDGLEWVDNLVHSGFGQTPPSHSHRYEVTDNSYSDSKPRAKTICLADVHPEPIRWLWPGRIALGKLTLIAGDPGLGKSLLTAYLAAVVSKGYTWPLGDIAAPQGSVMLLSAEDDPADTIRPRLDAAEADCERVHILQAIRVIDNEGNSTERLFSLKQDIAVLEELLPSLPDCRLLVIDPISAYLDSTKSHENADVRGLLAPLAALATRCGVAVVMVQHLNKNAVGSAIYRAMGSIAFVAAARAAYIVTKDRENQQRRLLMPAKNNLAKDNTGFAYTVATAENGAPVIMWELEPVTITADEALTPSISNEEQTDSDWAVTIVEQILSNGSVSAKEGEKEAREAGLTTKMARRAREKLGVTTRKADFKGGWVWELPHQSEDAQDAPTQTEGTLDADGHLGVE